MCAPARYALSQHCKGKIMQNWQYSRAGWLLLILPLLALAGCGSGSADNAGGRAVNGDESQQPRTMRRISAGMWESVTLINGHIQPPARSCVSEAEAAAINGDDAAVRVGLVKANAANGCRLENLHIAGSDIAFDTICSGKTIHSALSYRGETYTGTIAVEGSQAMALNARRIGPCSGGPAPDAADKP